MKLPRLLVTVFLMLILPWQGLAWAFMPVTATAPACHSTATDHVVLHGNLAATSQHSATVDIPAASPSDEENDRMPAAGHHCCQHASSGAVMFAWPGVPPAPVERQSTVRQLVTLYIPELPQRPPQH
jgi:hypothetical protein